MVIFFVRKYTGTGLGTDGRTDGPANLQTDGHDLRPQKCVVACKKRPSYLLTVFGRKRVGDAQMFVI